MRGRHIRRLWDYPTPYNRVIVLRDNKLADSRDTQVTLAEIPFVRLRDELNNRLLTCAASFGQTVATAQRALGMAPPSVVRVLAEMIQEQPVADPSLLGIELHALDDPAAIGQGLVAAVVEIVRFAHLKLQRHPPAGTEAAAAVDQDLPGFHQGAHHQGLEAIAIGEAIGVALGALPPIPPAFLAARAGPLGDDPGADDVVDQGIPRPLGPGVIPHQGAVTVAQSDQIALDLGIGASGRGVPATGAAGDLGAFLAALGRDQAEEATDGFDHRLLHPEHQTARHGWTSRLSHGRRCHSGGRDSGPRRPGPGRRHRAAPV